MNHSAQKLPLQIHLAVAVIFKKDEHILLLHRTGTKKFDNYYSLAGGSVEPGEICSHAAAREAKEEIGLLVEPEHLILVHVVQAMALQTTSDKDTLALIFLAERWSGIPKNIEPHKHGHIDWFPLEQLPEPLLPTNKIALECWKKQQLYSVIHLSRPLLD